MSRKPRFNLPGIPQHVIQRGKNRQRCFYLVQDYQRYLDELKKLALKYSCQIHAYALMTNHVHLLISPMSVNSVSPMMQALGRQYAKYINSTYQHTGILWEGCYKTSFIDSDMYLLACMCYIELKPVRAGLVSHPGEYKWSSYQQNTQRSHTGFIKNHQIFSMLGDTKKERQFVYRGLFHRYIENDVIHQICDALNHELVTGRTGLEDKIEAIIKRQKRVVKSERPCVKGENTDYYIYE